MADAEAGQHSQVRRFHLRQMAGPPQHAAAHHAPVGGGQAAEVAEIGDAGEGRRGGRGHRHGRSCSREAMSMTKRYLTSARSIRSQA